MKIGAMSTLLFATMLATTGLSSNRALAQSPAPHPSSPEEQVERARQVVHDLQFSQQSGTSSGFGYGSSVAGSPFFSGARTGPNLSSAIRKAAEAVRDAKGDEAKSDAQKKLAEVLSKSYDDDMAGREQELKQIEERLAKLRDLLERRRTKKQEIIDLQTKVALNEAEGLGFYDSERPGKLRPTTVTLPDTRVEVSTGGAIPAVPKPPAPPAPPAPPKVPR